jgi:PAS domain S-box-containing protein
MGRAPPRAPLQSSNGEDMSERPGRLGAVTLDSLPNELVLDRLFSAVPIGLAVFDRQHRFARINPALARMNRGPVAAHLGRSVTEVLGEEARPIETTIEHVLRTGRPVVGLEVQGRDGRSFLASYAPVTDQDGTALGVVAVVQDVSHRKAAELALSRALNRMTRLQKVTASLSAALTVDAVAEVIIAESMEAVGASCGVLAQRVDDRRLVIAHRFGMPGRPPGELPLDARAPMPEAIRRRAPVILESREDWLARYPERPPQGDFEAFAAVPLTFEGRAIGCMGLGLTAAGPLDDHDVGLLTAIARQAAQALERARLYDERATMARTLQDSLVPHALPVIEGLEVAGRYRPIAGGHEVGGDFYDVVELGDDRWLATIGDVCGKGAAAAVVSGLVRTTIAAFAVHADSAAAVLELVNRSVMRRAHPLQYATALCASLQRAGDGFTVELASAGHPPALILRADGHLEPVAAAGLMLGVEESVDAVAVHERLGPGDALVLYTDGVTEARHHAALFGEARLRASLRGLSGATAEQIVATLDAALEGFRAGPPRDDEAILVVRATS